MANLTRALQALDGTEAVLRPGILADRRAALAAEMTRLTPFMRRHTLEWEAFETVLALREELLELDLRFGQLDERGIFVALDRAGVLAHAVPGCNAAAVARAMRNPPAGSRAYLRGTIVGQLASRSGTYRCSWDHLDHGSNRHLDLTSPFATRAEWQAR